MTAGGFPGEECVVGHASEHHDDAEPRQQGKLRQQPAATGVELLPRRPVGGRRAAGRRGHPGITEHETIVPPHRRRLVGKSGRVQSREEPVPALVSGEDTARAVATMRCGREADDQHARRWVTESRDGPAPVTPVTEARHTLLRDALAVRDEPWAEPAPGETSLEALQVLTRHRGCRR